MIPKPKNLKTRLLQITCSFLIFFPIHTVLTTIQLDHNLPLKRAKISDVGTQWVLTPEFNALKFSSPKKPPHLFLGIGLLMP